jgi:hypothetical protein
VSLMEKLDHLSLPWRERVPLTANSDGAIVLR